MTIKTAIMSAISLALLCSCTRADDHDAEYARVKADLEAKMSAKGKIVFVTKDVQEGEVIPLTVLEEKEIEASKIPRDALTSASLVADRVTKYGLAEGIIVTQHDLLPKTAYLDVKVHLSDAEMKKLDKLAKEKAVAPSVLAAQWLDEAVKSTKKK